MNILVILLSLLLPTAFSQGRSISPDPFDEVDSRSGQKAEEPAEQEDLGDEPGTDASQQESSVRPTIVSLAGNINDFGRFADGGSDSNWYVGFDNAWIVRLPPIPEGHYSKVLIGAKLGRAKTVQSKDQSWERLPIPGKIYMAVSQRPGFSSEQSYFLVESPDIPLESHETVYMQGVGGSEWFWTEVQPSMVSSARPNYLIIWSPTREFRDAAHSPILAALQSPNERGGEPQAWNNHSIQGVPPRAETGTLQVPINLKPALAIKLIPSSGRRGVRLSSCDGKVLRDGLFFQFSASGTDLQEAWVEASQDGLEWRRVSPYRRQPPFSFTLPRSILTPRGVYLRGKARDFMANEGTGSNVLLQPEAAR